MGTAEDSPEQAEDEKSVIGRDRRGDKLGWKESEKLGIS